MKGQDFKKGVFAALQQCEFVRLGNLLRASGQGASIFVGTEKGFGDQWFVSVGLCLDGLGVDLLDRLEQSHMYFRLERLFPQHRELILTAGQLDDPRQPAAYQAFLGLLAGEVANDLERLASERGVVEAYRLGRLTGGLITKAARERLTLLA
jgi:hypothetical protein